MENKINLVSEMGINPQEAYEITENLKQRFKNKEKISSMIIEFKMNGARDYLLIKFGQMIQQLKHDADMKKILGKTKDLLGHFEIDGLPQE